MKCPKCGNECRKGILKVVNTECEKDAEVIMAWYSIERKKSVVNKDGLNLGSQAEGYYCEKCRKVFAIMEEKDDMLWNEEGRMHLQKNI